MKVNKILSWVFMLFAAACCTISCLMIYQTAGTECFVRHLATVSIGIGVAVLIVWIGWKSVLSCSGSAISLVCGLASIALLLESSHGCNAVLYVGDKPVITPGYFMVPAYIITMGYLRRINGDLWMALIATAICTLIPLFTLHSGIYRVMLVLACVLVPFAPTKQRWVGCAVVWGVATCMTLEPLFMGRGTDSFFDWWRVLYYAEALRWTPFVGSYIGPRNFNPLGGLYEDPISVAVCTFGRWVVPMLIAVAVALLVAIIIVVFQKKLDWPRKIVVVGAGVGLIFPLAACIERMYWPLRLGYFSAPFLSVGGSSMVASFMLLGLALAALNEEWRGTNNVLVASKRIEQVIGVLLVGVAIAGISVIVYQDYNSQSSRIERMLPKTANGFAYDRSGATELLDGSVWIPYRKIAGFGEPRVVESIHRVCNGIVLEKRAIPSEPPVVRASCRQMGSGIVVDCTDLYKREYSFNITEKEEVNHEEK